jgi:hypothetical protein
MLKLGYTESLLVGTAVRLYTGIPIPIKNNFFHFNIYSQYLNYTPRQDWIEYWKGEKEEHRRRLLTIAMILEPFKKINQETGIKIAARHRRFTVTKSNYSRDGRLTTLADSTSIAETRHGLPLRMFVYTNCIYGILRGARVLDYTVLD